MPEIIHTVHAFYIVFKTRWNPDESFIRKKQDKNDPIPIRFLEE